MGKHLLEDWSKIWTQNQGEEIPKDLWATLKQLIIQDQKYKAKNRGARDIISQEDVRRGMKVMKSGTAVGIDQWSPAQWKLFSEEAIDGITYLF